MKKYYRNIHYDDYVTSFSELMSEEAYTEKAIHEIGGKFSTISVVFIIGDTKYSLPAECFDNGLKDITAITERELLETWDKVAKPYLATWEKLKLEVEIGDKVNAKIIIFCPRGVILKTEKSFCGIANYDECRSYFGASKMCIGQILHLKIAGFDDENFWVLLKP